MVSALPQRNHRSNDVPFADRLRRAAAQARDAAQQLPQGPARDVLLKKADQAETAAQINEWLSAPGQQFPNRRL